MQYISWIGQFVGLCCISELFVEHLKLVSNFSQHRIHLFKILIDLGKAIY
jgi:uncharacterized membrane protein